MNITCLPGGLLGTNTYVVPAAGKRCFVVDPSVSASAISKCIRDEGLEPAFIVLTHGHYDHMESLVSLKVLYPQVKIFIHEKDSWALGSNALLRHEKSFRESGLGGLYTDFDAAKSHDSFPCADAYLSEGDVPEKDWTVLHTPGHSQGSICLYNEAQRLLISGDTLFYMGWGRTDLSGGNEEEIMQSLKRLSQLPSDVKVYPGHGRCGFTMAQNPIM